MVKKNLPNENNDLLVVVINKMSDGAWFSEQLRGICGCVRTIVLHD